MDKNTRKTLKITGWVIASPFILVVLLFVALYIPPIQKWAVDLTADYLSESTGMQISVDRMLLKFPLDLSVGGVKAMQDGDTLLAVDELVVDAEVMPLLHGEVAVNEVTLNKATVDTRDMIAAMAMKGHIGKLCTNDISFLLDEGNMTFPALSLAHSELTITLADSVPEDTTSEEASFLRTMDFRKLTLDDVALNLNLAPSADSMSVSTHFAKADLACLLNLEEGNYYVKPLNITDSDINYNIGHSTPLEGFDANHINLSHVTASIDSLSYLASGDLYVGINSLAGTERSGLALESASGIYRMDSTSLSIEQFGLVTAESDISLDMKMDLTAFNDVDPGQLSLTVDGTVGKADILPFTADMMQAFGKSWPAKPMKVALAANGNMQQLSVPYLQVDMDGAFSMSGDLALENLTDPNGNIGIQTHMTAQGGNLAFVNGLLPADIASAFRIPAGMKVEGDVSMTNNRLLADVNLAYGKSSAALKADYNMNNDRYDVDLVADRLAIDAFVPMTDSCSATGHITARGQGFNFDSPATHSDATVEIKHVAFGPYNLNGTEGMLTLANQSVNADIDFHDERLEGSFLVDGTMNNKGIDGTMTIDLPFADIQALGLSDDPLTIHATHGDFKANSNFGNMFLLDAVVDGVEVVYNEDSLVTEMFNLYAQSTADTTNINLKTSDLNFDLHSPRNLFALIDDFTKLGETTVNQLQTRTLDLDHLRQMMPLTSLKANIGNKNPISKFVAMQGIRFDKINANLVTSPDSGLLGNLYAYNFRKDSIRVDTFMFDINQDTSQITFNATVDCPDQDLCAAFTAALNGYISPRNADVHLTYMNDMKVKGIDLGLKAQVQSDSVFHVSLYPQQPIIAYTPFNLNENNYIDIHNGEKVFADVLLLSTKDSCSISLYANPVDSQLQNVEAVVKNVDIEGLLTVMPFIPRMTGLLEVDANYIQTAQGYTVDGLVAADNFAYEGTKMGNIMTMLNYQPTGEAGHDINAMLFKDEEHVATIKGDYNVKGTDCLNASAMLEHLPLSMANAFMDDPVFALSGYLGGMVTATGKIDSLLVNGFISTDNVHVSSDIYSFDLAVEDDNLLFNNSCVNLDTIRIYGAGETPLTVNGSVDFKDFNEIKMNLSLYGQNFLVFDAERTNKTALFGKLYGDFLARVNGTTDDLKVRGMINVLKSTDITYVMTNTPLTIDYRLDDIVTFVDFSAPPSEGAVEPRTFMGIDMIVRLEIEDGAKMRCEFSADKQSYVNVQGGGTLTMTYTPEGVFNLLGRYTLNEGEMKYTLPVIPLKTFTIEKGCYIEFTGKPANPTMNITATEQTKASVSNADGSSRTVLFNVGLKITNTLENMGLEFTIDAPEDITVRNELAGMTSEEKNKLAVALLATGMYLSSTNQSGFSTSNALNNFLQTEINNIAGKAISTATKIDMSVGMEQTKRDDGTTRTDYSFKFTRRFFSDRLNVVIGGRINADGNKNGNEAGAYIDDVSLEWRLNDGGTQYIRLFHDKNYDNLVEGELTENGAGIVLRKKLDSITDLFIWKKKKDGKENK